MWKKKQKTQNRKKKHHRIIIDSPTKNAALHYRCQKKNESSENTHTNTKWRKRNGNEKNGNLPLPKCADRDVWFIKRHTPFAFMLRQCIIICHRSLASPNNFYRPMLILSFWLFQGSVFLWLSWCISFLGSLQIERINLALHVSTNSTRSVQGSFSHHYHRYMLLFLP